MRFSGLIVFLLAGLGSSARGAEIPGGSAMHFAGFGADTLGGRGGRILKVTNLNAGGAGSLRAALESAGSRIVVFEVGGIIDWRKETVTITNGRLTLAGETAPRLASRSSAARSSSRPPTSSSAISACGSAMAAI